MLKVNYILLSNLFIYFYEYYHYNIEIILFLFLPMEGSWETSFYKSFFIFTAITVNPVIDFTLISDKPLPATNNCTLITLWLFRHRGNFISYSSENIVDHNLLPLVLLLLSTASSTLSWGDSLCASLW